MNKYEIVRRLCEQRGISIRKLEQDLGFSNGYILKMKRSEPNNKAIMKIAGYFNVSPYIFSDIDNLNVRRLKTPSQKELSTSAEKLSTSKTRKNGNI